MRTSCPGLLSEALTAACRAWKINAGPLWKREKHRRAWRGFVCSVFPRHWEGMTCALREQYGELPLVYAGGVMSNTLLKERLTTRFGGRFAPPDLSADNAAGIALLGAVKESGLSCL